MWELISKLTNSKFFLLLTLFTGYHLSLIAQPSDLYINEFMASNLSTVLSERYDEFTDWIEIHNAGTEEVSLQGLYITDDPSDSAKFWIRHDIILPPGGYFVFWADGRNDYNHTNFKLARKGEFIGLYDEDFNVVDTITYGLQENDASFGRKVDDLQTWVMYDVPTPGYTNHNLYVTGKCQIPDFSIPGGYFSGSQTISLSSSITSGQIYYSFDGTPPDMEDFLYTSPITIDTTHAIRARVFENGKLPSEVITQTYLIDEDVHLPVVSITTDPVGFFDDSLGIYVIGTNGRPGYCSDIPHNTNMDWERAVNVELYDIHGNVEINQRCGVKIYGGCSRTRYPQKSLALYARGEYGKGSFDVQLFDQKPIYQFETFILRNSADDCRYAMFKDAMGQSVIVGKTDIDWQAYRPAVVFLNGQYWGIQNIREKLNEHYPAGNYNIDPDDINLVRGHPEWGLMHGSSADYVNMIEHIENKNLSADIMYQYVKNKIDINNYIDYQITEIYYGANDWPMNNLKFWRANKGKNDKWRWILYDLDNCFRAWDADHNTLYLATDPYCRCTWPNPPWSTLLFRKVLENAEFRNEFIQRYAYHMSTTFLADRINHFIDSLKANIAPEIPRHIERWGGKIVPFPEHWIRPNFNSMEEWEEAINGMKRYVNERRDFAEEHVRDHFNLQSGMMSLTITSANPEAGKIKLNNQEIEEGFHQGEYFKNIPFQVRAMSHIGYQFSHWEYTEIGKIPEIMSNAEITINNHLNIALEAHFEPVPDDGPYVIINEINYNSHPDFNTGDWIELYNKRNEPIDLTGWTLKDDNDDHIFTFPDGLDIGPHDFLVVCEDVLAFKELFPEVVDPIGGVDFGFGNGGDAIRIYASDGSLRDVVYFEDAEPWPTQPDGEGPTLELISPNFDNQMPDSWVVSFRHGTPGIQNQFNNISENALGQNYPNPMSGSTVIPYQIFTPGFVVIKIIDSMGRNIGTVLEEQQEPGLYEIHWDAGELNTGVYFYSMAIDNEFVATKRMAVLR